MNRLKVVLVVSTDPSDLYFGNVLARRLGAVGIVVENQSVADPLPRRVGRLVSRALKPWQLPRLLKERGIVAEHVRRSGAIDRAGFGEDGYGIRVPQSCRVIEVCGCGAVNAPETVRRVRELQPDLLVLCGCSILKKEILAVPRLGALNLHGGLAQRYRGVWTTLWAVVNREPEYVGATVHFVSPGIDDGAIVYQGRPEIAPDDNPESLYVKVVHLGVEMMAAAVEAVAAGTVRRHQLREKGRLYLSAAVTPEVLAKAWAETERGVIPEYLAERESRDAKVVELMQGTYSAGGC